MDKVGRSLKKGERRPWAVGKKRSVKNIPIYPRKATFIEDLVTEIKGIDWPYAKHTTSDGTVDTTTRDMLIARDQALIALIIMLGTRISEALKFQKQHFTVLTDRIDVADFTPLKHGDNRANHYLPKTGNLAPLTQIFESWLTQVPNSEDYIFPSAWPWANIHWERPINRQRAHWIIKTTIKKFPHWYRGVCETLFGKIVFKNDPFKLARFMGLKRLDSTLPYVGEPYEHDVDNFNQGQDS